MMLTVGSLFAGVGGFDLAFEQTGRFRTVWMSEVDEHASAVLAHHWPTIPNYGDIHDLEPSDVEPVDVVTAGFPCPDFSVSGPRRGLDGERGRLWWETHRVVDRLRPTWFVAENVLGIISSNEGRDFRDIVDSLVDLGYGVGWRVANSRWFGVPQQRRRVIIVGHIGGRPPAEVLALGEGVPGHPRPGRQTGANTRPPARSSLGTGEVARTVMPTFGAKWYSNLQEVNAGSLLLFAQNQRREVRDLEVSTAVEANPGTSQRTYLRPPGQMVRRFTPLECERLQGFPDGWTDLPGASDTQRIKQMGNAVTVPVFAWLAARIAEVGA